MLRKNIKTYLFVFLFLIEISFLFFQAFHQTLQNDENEHLYDAYMIFKGLSPYTDFFEHHNPLMWYLTAPLFIFFENDISIYYVLRFFMFVCIIITGLFIYKISQKLKLPIFYSLMAICFYFGFDYVKLTGIQIRPDTPMALSTTIAFYYILVYLNTRRIFHLFLSITFFCLSFWLLQKAIALIFPISLFLIILIIQRKIPLTDILYASSVPFLLSFLYILWLYKNNALNLYYIYNYLGNFTNSRLYDFYKFNSYMFTYKNAAIVFCLISSLLTLLLGIKKKDKKIILLPIYALFGFFIITHILFAADKHYMLPLLPLFSIIISLLLEKITYLSNNSWKTIFLILFICFQIHYDYKLKNETNYPFSYYMNLNKFITENTEKNDLVLTKNITGLKQQAEGYYYFGLQYITSAFQQITLYKKIPDKKEIIIKKQPKIIYDDLIVDAELLDFIQKNYTIKTIQNVTFLVKNYP